MVRSTHYLRIIEKENLVENAAKVGAYFLEQLLDWQRGCDNRFSGARPRLVYRVRPTRRRNARQSLAEAI